VVACGGYEDDPSCATSLRDANEPQHSIQQPTDASRQTTRRTCGVPPLCLQPIEMLRDERVNPPIERRVRVRVSEDGHRRYACTPVGSISGPRLFKLASHTAAGALATTRARGERRLHARLALCVCVRALVRVWAATLAAHATRPRAWRRIPCGVVLLPSKNSWYVISMSSSLTTPARASYPRAMSPCSAHAYWPHATRRSPSRRRAWHPAAQPCAARPCRRGMTVRAGGRWAVGCTDRCAGVVLAQPEECLDHRDRYVTHLCVCVSACVCAPVCVREKARARVCVYVCVCVCVIVSGRAAAVRVTAHIEDSAFLQQSHPLFDVERFLQQSPSLTRKPRCRCGPVPTQIWVGQSQTDVERRVWYERPWAVPAAPATPSTPDPSTHRPERRIVAPSTKPPNRCAHAHARTHTHTHAHAHARTCSHAHLAKNTDRPRSASFWN